MPSAPFWLRVITFPSSSLVPVVSCLQVSEQTFHKPFSILWIHMASSFSCHLLLSISCMLARVLSASGKPFDVIPVFLLGGVYFSSLCGTARPTRLRSLPEASQLSRTWRSHWSYLYLRFQSQRLVCLSLCPHGVHLYHDPDCS